MVLLTFCLKSATDWEGICSPLRNRTETVAAATSLGAPLQKPPNVVRSLALVGIGTLVGTSFGPDTVAALATRSLPILTATAGAVTAGLALAFLVSRWLKVDMPTAFLACSPGGMSQMIIIADELGANTLVVCLFQLARRISVVVMLPVLFRLLV